MKKMRFFITVCTFVFFLPFIMGCPCENNTCDDGLFCNGVERCMQQGDETVCLEGIPPCRANETCDEAIDECIPPGQEECATLGNNGLTSSALSPSALQLDLPVRQVLIEARIVGATDDSIRDLGIDFNLPADIVTSSDEPASAYSDENRDVVVDSSILGGPVDTSFLVPGNQPANGFIGYVNYNFIPRFDQVQTFIQLPPVKACVNFAPGSFIIPLGFPGLPNYQNLPSEDRGYGGDTLFYNLLNSSQLATVLQALEAEGKNTVLSAPSVVTVSGQRFVHMVNDIQPSLGEVKEEFAESITEVTISPFGIFTGVALDVTPTITDDNTVELEVRIGTQVLSYYYSIPFIVNGIQVDLQVPLLKTSEAMTQVLVQNGETVVLGGLLREGSQEVENGVPGLRDIPLLRSVFKGDNLDSEEQELLFFITPTIIQGE